MKLGRKTVFWSGWIVFGIILFSSIPASSTQTELWETSSFDEFRRGELENVSLTATGEVMLAPQSEQVLTLEDQDLFVWALARDSKGNLYAGTGDQGKIFKIAPDGEESLFFDSPEIGIMSLAVDAADNVYAGSAPDGLIYKITPEGSQTTLFSTGEHYVWALAFDSNNVLYAGTGESGKIFKILPDGSGTELYDSPQSHIMSLLYDAQGWLYAGTEGEGITYKIGLDGSVFSLYSTEEEEVHSLTLDSQGNLYIAAISNKFYPKAPAAPESTEQQQPRPKDKRLKKSSIYQISPAGTVRKILELPETLIYAMIADENDQLLLGTDEKGMLYRVFLNGKYHQVITIETGNILSLLRDPSGQLYVGTGDAGAVYRLSVKGADQGTYLSSIHDVKTTATWGKIFWRGTTNQIALLTRTGNTSVPDDTWSPWSEELQNMGGDVVPNPPARFIQWKAVLTPQEEQNPVLEEVSVAYLPNNLPPEIQQVSIYHAVQNEQPNNNSSGNSLPSPSRKSQTDNRKPEATPKPPKYVPPGYIAVVWGAEDPNHEGLVYTVALRGENEANWKVLEEELETTTYVLDTVMFPDGEYYVKVTAADTPNNPPDRALKAEKVSERFEIDNTAPEISIALNQKQGQTVVLITVIAQDEFSRLQHAEYSLDAGEWTAIFPDDEVTDSRDEKYSIPLPDLTPDQHVLTFKAIDAHNNVGVAKFVFSPQTLEPTQEQTQEETQ
jgi:sugar lactone lactonase YvrE